MTRKGMLGSMLNMTEMLHLGMISQDDYDWFRDLWIKTFRYMESNRY